MSNLENKVAVVTGGTSGIGFASAQTLINEGAKVIITGRRKNDVDSAAEKLSATGIVADQSSLKSIEQFAAEVQEKFGAIDILFLNAGLTTFSSIETASEEHYDSMMNTNVKGTFFTVQKFLPIIKDGGSIIFMASVNASLGAPGSAVYSASKAAIISLNRVLAKELSPRRIRVNAISPGPIETPLYSKLGLNEEQLKGFGNVLSGRSLLGRFGQAYEIANVVKFLASEDASFINGTEITIDGGLTVDPLG
ncbi:SDR family oxidoreductase [Danxiaibacter flavus]|uniref:SDR family oxidoreductase n=1 Tax=Danxiaibacter flavus TaxID=3049108 RepID=A0ABV3ZKH4_9BACT|nr:SDR family oxidoreductase [Chitinophagaceae bacterium DXS]